MTTYEITDGRYFSFGPTDEFSETHLDVSHVYIGDVPSDQVVGYIVDMASNVNDTFSEIDGDRNA